MICNLCPRKCGAIRTEKENINGFCKMPLLPKVARAALHFGEEPIISGENGSGTVFFSGCSLKCVFCQNEVISHGGQGIEISYERLAQIFKELEEKGANNINLVSPTHYVNAIIKALDIYRPNIPIVYNSSGYESVETLRLLKDYVDVYLIDFKYIDSKKAADYSFAPDYPQIAEKAVIECINQKGSAVIQNGIMKSGVIVRHLLLPSSTRDAIKIFDFVKDNASDAYLSLMGQYVPLYGAQKFPEINRKITKREYEKVCDYIISSAFQNCFVQELSSAVTDYIPQFNGQGVL